MLSSRRSSAISTIREDQRRRGAAPSARGAAVPSGAAAVEEAGSGGATPDHFLTLGRALDARPFGLVGPRAALGDELQARVHLCRSGQPPGDLRQEELHN